MCFRLIIYLITAEIGKVIIFARRGFTETVLIKNARKKEVKISKATATTKNIIKLRKFLKSTPKVKFETRK